MNEQHGNRIATTILNRLYEIGYEVRESGSYAKLEAEAQALRDQVKALQSDANSWQSGYDEGRRMGTKHRQDEVEQLTREVEALRARVVVVDEDGAFDEWWEGSGFYKFRETAKAAWEARACLNGKVVSEGLLRRLLDSDGIDGKFDAQEHYAAHQELKALLGEGKEVGDVLVR